MTGTTWCGRHRHDTLEGAARCRQKLADRKVKRAAEVPPRYELEEHFPAVPELRGSIVVWIFRRGSVI